MLVQEVQPGEVVIAHGWDIVPARQQELLPSETVGFLIPHNMNHKASVEMGHSVALLYIGPTHVRFAVRDFAGEDGAPATDEPPHTRKMHRFLTETGSLVALEGYEFRHLSQISFVK
tara:strand:+ start:191 stop:541 length:351 start_codon:yes stop_codon:yes gene_type:complete